MAENEKQTVQAEQTASAENKQKTEEEKKEETERLNRQINFFVMRTMWQIAHGRGGSSIYSKLTMSRERFTRVIEYGTVKYRKGEVEKLASTLSVSPDILLGRSRFKFTTKGKGSKEEDIDPEDWTRLFQFRKDRRVHREEMDRINPKSEQWENEKKLLEGARKAYAKQRDDIQEKLRQYEHKGYTDRNLNRLYTSMKKNWTKKDVYLREFEAVMSSLDINTLEECEVNELQNLKRTIKQKDELITALIVYKKAKKVKK